MEFSVSNKGEMNMERLGVCLERRKTYESKFFC